VLEIWHDSGIPCAPDGIVQSEFLGEVECTLDLLPDEPVKKHRERLPLTPNYDKAQRRVQGSLTFEYSWQPPSKPRPDSVVLLGHLEVTVVAAENLLGVDWNGSYLSDPYCVVRAWPRSPELDGAVAEVRKQTATLFSTNTPIWDEPVDFDYCWTQLPTTGTGTVAADPKQQCADAAAGLKRERSKGEALGDAPKGTCGSSLDLLPETKSDVLRRTIPELQEEVERLKALLPQLQTEVDDVRRDMHLILSALKNRKQQCICGAGALGDSVSGTPSHRGDAASHAASLT